MTAHTRKRLANEQGFTLIELMIVIAIIGILAAIAIPNFISYRNKSFCSGTESDAGSVLSAVADYFAIPTNTSISPDKIEAKLGDKLSNGNTWTLDTSDTNKISVAVTDVTGRCPQDYRDAKGYSVSPRAYWDSQNFVKTM